MNKKTTLLLGAFFGGLGIAIGAFGAHALKPMLTANNRVDVFEVAVRYQIYHSFALLIGGILLDHFSIQTQLRVAAICWMIGIVLFSGSLYALSFFSIGPFALLTPLGGAFFLGGWGFLLVSILKNK